MAFTPTIRHKSVVLPGVAFTVHRAGLTKRIEIDKRTLAMRSRMAEIRAEYPPHSERELDLIDQVMLAARKADAVPADASAAALAEVRALQEESRNAATEATRKKRAALDTEWSDIESQIHAEWVRSGLVSIDYDGPLTGVGFDLPGMTPDELLDYGPPALAEEIYRALATDGILSQDSAKNSPSPSTSRPAEATSTIVAGASESAST